ncbi:DUF1552 domain-containing protein [Marinagarivorans algicola]|uniref:DUF1552 domain-containing protein n=1 Tax=Marinagarivorans algicola TaxID=1513270 RepID=UPI0006B89511|nr:DUF1552 domain-containing protein [Marinagarivorans algicola]
MKNKVTRRDILKKGTATLGLPWLEYFAGSTAMAADETPKRLCVLINSLGTIPKEWVSGNASNYRLGNILRPLEAHKDKMTIIRGLTQNGENGAHPGAQAGLLTSRPLEGNKDTSNNVQGPSFDQRIASQISNGVSRRSIHMALDATKAFSHKGPNQPILPLMDPFKAFDQYFGGIGGGSGSAPTREEKLNVVRATVLNDTRARYQELKARVGAEDKGRLEQHLEGLNELISRLEFQNNSTNDTDMSACELPVIGSQMSLPSQGSSFKEGDALRNNQAKYNAINRTYMDITAQAFACNVTRVSVVNIGKYHAHGGESHKANVNNRGSNAGAYDAIVNAGAQAAKNINYLVNTLSAMPEGNGSVMDNTMIMWATELADGAAHSGRDSRQLLIGNAGGAFNMGRLVDVPTSANRPHSELLTSLINCYGINDTQFGVNKWKGRGRLAELQVNV